MVTHHHLHQFNPSALHQTFETAQSVNSIIAISAGIIGSYSVAFYRYFDLFPLSPPCTAPFHFSALVLVLTFALIQLKWIENYGFGKAAPSISSPSTKKQAVSSKRAVSGLFESITYSLDILLSDSRIIAVGVIQSGFESALYVFIFLWTKCLDEVSFDPDGTGEAVPFDHGIVFAIMMISCFIGTRLVALIRVKSAEIVKLEWCSIQYLQCVQLSALCVVCAVTLFAVPMVSTFNGRLCLFVVKI